MKSLSHSHSKSSLFSLLIFTLFESLISSVVDVIKNTGEGALDIFQFLLKNLHESNSKGDQVLLNLRS